MANEATLMVETHLPVMMKCANGTGIAKGALLKLTDNMTAIIHSGDEDPFAGVAAEEKIASDGKTKIAVYRDGIFKMTCSAAITSAGATVALSATVNKVKIADKTCLSSKIVGICFDVTAGADETCIVELRPGCNCNTVTE